MSSRSGGPTTRAATGRGGSTGRGRGKGRGGGQTQTPNARSREGGTKEGEIPMKILTETVIKPESNDRDEINAVMEIQRLDWSKSQQTESNTMNVEEEDNDEAMSEKAESMSMDGSNASDLELVGVKPPEPKQKRWQDSFESESDDSKIADEEMREKDMEKTARYINLEETGTGSKDETSMKRKQDDMKKHATQKVSPDKLIGIL